MKYLAITFEGIEDVCAKELGGKKVGPGRVTFSSLKDTRSANTILTLLKQATIKSFEDVVDAVKDLFLDKKATYKVSCTRSGEHKFKSIDIERACGEILYKEGYSINLKEPQNILYIDIIDTHCFIGLLLKENLCRREYRVKFNNQNISSCLAFALLQLIDYKKEESLLDPICKDGVIPIEAFISGGKNIHATDYSKNNIRNAIINGKMAKAKVEPEQLELEQLEKTYEPNSIDKMATVIFTSKKDKYSMTRLRELLNQAKKIIKEKIGIISNTTRIKELIPDEISLQEERTIKVGGMNFYLFILKK